MGRIVRLSSVLFMVFATLASLPSRALAVTSTTFSNTAQITIPGTGTFGRASPYPSTIAVSGVTGTVTKVIVTLHNMTHAFTSDIDILLVGPSGQKLLLMSDTGLLSRLSGTTLTLDDAAASALPLSVSPALPLAILPSGTYRPTNYDLLISDVFPSPAPGAPYGTTLGIFNNQDPNGTWSLYVVDDLIASTGRIAGGWSLTITTVDQTPPTISITTPADGAQYLLNQPVYADYSCDDETELASCVGTVEDGAAIDTSTVGNHTFSVTAEDAEGNTTVESPVYTVVYPFSGFFQPVDNPGTGEVPVFNKAKAGSAIPVKFSLGGNQGLNIFPVGSPGSKQVNCDGSATTDPVEETVTAGNSSLQYDAASDTYTYVWKTEKNWATTCRVLIVTLNDTTEHLAYFNFTK